MFGAQVAVGCVIFMLLVVFMVLYVCFWVPLFDLLANLACTTHDGIVDVLTHTHQASSEHRLGLWVRRSRKLDCALQLTDFTSAC